MDFDGLFDACYPSLRRYCGRLTGDQDSGDDVAQEAFVRLLERKPQGTQDGLRSWLFTVATHLVRDRVRVSENRRRLLDQHPVGPSAPPNPEEEISRQERVESVRRALEELGSRDRSLLLMREEGLSYRELADALGVSPASVGTLLARARERLAKALNQEMRSNEASG